MPMTPFLECQTNKLIFICAALYCSIRWKFAIEQFYLEFSGNHLHLFGYSAKL